MLHKQGCVVVCPGRNTVLNTISILTQCENTVLNTISILTQCENTILNTISSLLILIVFSFLVFLIVFCTDTVSILCSVSWSAIVRHVSVRAHCRRACNPKIHSATKKSKPYHPTTCECWIHYPCGCGPGVAVGNPSQILLFCQEKKKISLRVSNPRTTKLTTNLYTQGAQRKRF